MSKASSLTVVVPRLLERLHSESAPLADDSCVALLAGRGDIARRWQAADVEDARLKPWQRGLLAMLQLDAKCHPSAPLTALGLRAASECVDWLHAEPIHLAAGLNEVALVPLRPELELSDRERDAMTAVLREHAAAEGWTLQPSARAWLIGSPRAFDVRTVTPEFAARHEWNAVLPQGPEASRIRRMMTELQMLLHEHPANATRAARGTPAVNSLWLWGNGAARPQREVRPPVCVGMNDYLRGICALNGWPTPHEPTSVDAVLASAQAGEAIVCVLEDAEPARFEREWLVPFVAALKRERIERLELVLDEWLLTIDRWRLRRFWRRPLPLAAWAAA